MNSQAEIIKKKPRRKNKPYGPNSHRSHRTLQNRLIHRRKQLAKLKNGQSRLSEAPRTGKIKRRKIQNMVSIDSENHPFLPESPSFPYEHYYYNSQDREFIQKKSLQRKSQFPNYIPEIIEEKDKKSGNILKKICESEDREVNKMMTLHKKTTLDNEIPDLPTKQYSDLKEGRRSEKALDNETRGKLDLLNLRKTPSRFEDIKENKMFEVKKDLIDSLPSFTLDASQEPPTMKLSVFLLTLGFLFLPFPPLSIGLISIAFYLNYKKNNYQKSEYLQFARSLDNKIEAINIFLEKEGMGWIECAITSKLVKRTTKDGGSKEEVVIPTVISCDDGFKESDVYQFLQKRFEQELDLGRKEVIEYGSGKVSIDKFKLTQIHGYQYEVKLSLIFYIISKNNFLQKLKSEVKLDEKRQELSIKRMLEYSDSSSSNNQGELAPSIEIRSKLDDSQNNLSCGMSPSVSQFSRVSRINGVRRSQKPSLTIFGPYSKFNPEFKDLSNRVSRTPKMSFSRLASFAERRHSPKAINMKESVGVKRDQPKRFSMFALRSNERIMERAFMEEASQEKDLGNISIANLKPSTRPNIEKGGLKVKIKLNRCRDKEDSIEE